MIFSHDLNILHNDVSTIHISKAEFALNDVLNDFFFQIAGLVPFASTKTTFL